MPTGVALRDPREQLFAAARRILVREGATGLTSRAVTLEAGVAKGVLHRHFADFDDFVAELIRQQISAVEQLAASLLRHAGTSTVADNLADALSGIFDPVALSIVALVTSRDGLRERLRDTTTRLGLPLLSQATQAIDVYLREERELGRIDAMADTGTVALTVIGTGHLLFAGEFGAQPDTAAVREVVESILIPIVRMGRD